MVSAWLWTSVATDVYPLYPLNNRYPHFTVPTQTSTARSQSGVTWRHRAVFCPPLSYTVILCTTKILLPRFLKCKFPLLALTETCFEVNTLWEIAPERSVCTAGWGIEGGDALAAPAMSYSRDLSEYMITDACCKLSHSLLYIIYFRF